MAKHISFKEEVPRPDPDTRSWAGDHDTALKLMQKKVPNEELFPAISKVRGGDAFHTWRDVSCITYIYLVLIIIYLGGFQSIISCRG